MVPNHTKRLIFLTHFTTMFYFCTPWKHYNIAWFLSFSGDIEMEHWSEMGFLYLLTFLCVINDLFFWIFFQSSGVGRSGVFIALRSLEEVAQASGTMNIFRIVQRLRQQRTAMVQSLVGYLAVSFLYRVCLFPSTVKASPDWNKTINVMPGIRPAMLCWGNYSVSSTFIATS